MGLSLKSHLLSGRPPFFIFFIFTLRYALIPGLHGP